MYIEQINTHHVYTYEQQQIWQMDLSLAWAHCCSIQNSEYLLQGLTTSFPRNVSSIHSPSILPRPAPPLLSQTTCTCSTWNCILLCIVFYFQSFFGFEKFKIDDPESVCVCVCVSLDTDLSLGKTIPRDILQSWFFFSGESQQRQTRAAESDPTWWIAHVGGMHVLSLPLHPFLSTPLSHPPSPTRDQRELARAACQVTARKHPVCISKGKGNGGHLVQLCCDSRAHNPASLWKHVCV